MVGASWLKPDGTSDIGADPTMNIDGESRQAFLRDQAKDLQFGVVPMPVSDASRYGGTYIAGSVTGVSWNAKNPEAAWALVKYLTTDTAAIVKLSNSIRSLPTALDSLASKELVVDNEFQVFLDMFKSAAPDSQVNNIIKLAG